MDARAPGPGLEGLDARAATRPALQGWRRRRAPRPGSPRKVNEYVFEDKPACLYERLAGAECERVLVFRHIRKPWVHDYGGVLFVNCGSVGKPRTAIPHVAFAILETAGNGVEETIERVAYDTEGIAAEVREACLPVEFADDLVVAT